MMFQKRLLSNAARHETVAEYRRTVYEKYDIVPLVHQAEWILAGEGWILTTQKNVTGEPSACVQLADGSHEMRLIVPRPGGAAHVLVDLAGFKAGKSFGIAMWACGYAGLSDASIDMIGLEYDTSEPEFNYLADLLLSERGMNLPTSSFRNNKKDGSMWITLEAGAHFEVKSYRASRRSETLKGKKRDAYIFCLPMNAPIWMGDYSFAELGDIKVGDQVIGMTRYNPPGVSRGGRKIGEGNRRRLERATVTAIHRKLDRIYRVKMESGREIQCTLDHRWLSGAVTGDFAWVTPGPRRTFVHIVDDPGPPEGSEWARGWLAGIYDGEGSRTIISQKDYNNQSVYAMIDAELKALGFVTARQKDGVRWNGGRSACLKFLNWTGSPRYRLKYADEALLAGRAQTKDQVISVDFIAETEVGCLTTTLGNFVAYGYLSHNCEAYQLPGFHVWSHVAQNVRQLDGFGVFATTPDRAWVKELHDKAHGRDSYYHCTCDVDAQCNPHTFDQSARDRDDPDKGGLMTRERFAIAWGGKVNRHIGAVYDYEKDAQLFSPLNFPTLWTPEAHALAMTALP